MPPSVFGFASLSDSSQSTLTKVRPQAREEDHVVTSPHASPTSYVLAASPRYDRTYGTPIRPARQRGADVCPLCPGMPLVDDARYASSAPRCVKLSFRRPLAYRRPLSCHPSLVAALAPWFDSSSDAHPGREVRGGLTIIGKARKANIVAAMSPQVVHPCVSPLLLTSQPSPPHIIKTPTSASPSDHIHPLAPSSPHLLSHICMSIRTVSGRREELPLPPPSSCFVPSPHTLHPVFCLHFVVPSSSLLSSVFCSRLPSIYPLRVFPFLRGCGLLFYRVLPSIALHLPPTCLIPGTDSPVDGEGRFGRGGARALAAWNLDSDSCPIPPLHRFVVNRSAPDTLPLVPLPAAVSIPPFLCFCSPCSLFPVPLTHRIDNQSRPRPQYSVHRPQRRERE